MDWFRKNVLSYFVSGEDGKSETPDAKRTRKFRDTDFNTPILAENPPHIAPKPDQGLRWASERLKKDEDGDEAHEFLEFEQR